MEGCVFCEIVAGRAPAFIVEEGEFALALLDIQPLSRGHCLVIPRRHVEWWDEMTAEETAEVFELARRTAGRIRRAFKPDCVTMYARGRRIPHTHIFLVPTHKNDPLDRLFNALEGFQEEADALAHLREHEHLAGALHRLEQA